MENVTIKNKPMNFEYTKEKIDEITVIHMKGNLMDKSQSLAFMDDFDKMMASGDNKLVLDMAGLAYMNSSGLNVIINVLTKSRKSGGDVAIASVSPKIRQLLVITKLSSIFNLSESVADAIKALN